MVNIDIDKFEKVGTLIPTRSHNLKLNVGDSFTTTITYANGDTSTITGEVGTNTEQLFRFIRKEYEVGTINIKHPQDPEDEENE